MQTNFTLAELADPHIQDANDILRKCVHCGFCTATCPTFVLLGDELDSPRGRIYQIREMLEGSKPATKNVAKHLDRCLSCLSCMTTCPSGVDYMHLVDHARVHVEATFTRPLPERLLREMLAFLVPRPALFRLSLAGSLLARPFRKLLPGRLRTMVEKAPKRIVGPSPVDKPQVSPAEGTRRKRVVLMQGCAQQVLRPAINEATVRLLTRHGCEVVVAAGADCCGAMVHHMGKEAAAQQSARANIAAWERVADGGCLDAIVVNVSGCGTTVKDYGWLLKHDADWAERAASIAALTRDVSEVMAELGVSNVVDAARPVVAYHHHCTTQHWQKLKAGPVALLRDAGFDVREPAESHLCCGSAGIYNIMQPALAERLRQRKLDAHRATGGAVIAVPNIGCLSQLTDDSNESALPVVHMVELLDWATGGPKPPEIA